MSALDAVDGSRHRHRDVPKCGCYCRKLRVCLCEVVPIRSDTALLNRVRVTGFDDGANPTIETQRKVTLMLQCNEKIIKHKVGLLNLAEELGNVSKASQMMMGLSHDTLYRNVSLKMFLYFSSVCLPEMDDLDEVLGLSRAGDL